MPAALAVDGVALGAAGLLAEEDLAAAGPAAAFQLRDLARDQGFVLWVANSPWDEHAVRWQWPRALVLGGMPGDRETPTCR